MAPTAGYVFHCIFTNYFPIYISLHRGGELASYGMIIEMNAHINEGGRLLNSNCFYDHLCTQ